MSRKKGFISSMFVILLSLFGLSLASTADAYVFSDNGQRFFKCSTCATSYPTYKWGDYIDGGGTTVIKTGWQNAMSSWHSKQSKVEFVYSSSATSKLHSMHNNNKALFGEMSYTWDSLKYVKKFNGYLNAYADHDNQRMSSANVAKSTAVHELGHVMGIDHTSGTSIMNSDRNRNTMTVPQTDDVNGIKARYK